MTQKLLPENSTKLEKDLVDSFDREDALNNAIALLQTAKCQASPPESYLPSLIWEYNIGELSQWIGTNQELYTIGREFARIKGTIRSLRLALSLIEVDPDTIEEGNFGHWARFQMDIGIVPTGQQMLQDIVDLSNLAKPLRSRLVRLYHGINIKPLILNSDSSILNQGILNNYSGYYDTDLKVWLSFRDTQNFDVVNTIGYSVSFGGEINAGFVDATYIVSQASVQWGSFTQAGYYTYNIFSAPVVIPPNIIASEMTYVASADELP